MTDLELDQILTIDWPRIVRRVMGDTGADEFVRNFVRSIARAAKRQAWKPTDKQLRIMRQVLRDYGGQPEPQFDLIERD